MDISHISPEVALGVPSGAALVFLALKKLILKTASLDTTKAAVDAEGEVIDILRGEVVRLAAGNKQLHEELQRFHTENALLRKEVTLLQTTIEELTSRINVIDRLRADCEGCQYNILPNRRSKLHDRVLGMPHPDNIKT
jgi:hypothetical protein